ncbi:MAG: arsenate reductase (glutaredoxin) [Bacteroidales bacterium]|nr:arsenate reductase (glutaredoxin) [Bacteroidales bacterium]MCF8351857.1 arsenate reductase (glutaredoxin) [Bacteroidales bacterium]
MNMITIYHNPRCKKSRAGLQYLEEKGVDFNIRKYLQQPLSKAELKDLLMKLDKKPSDIVRTQEDIYKKQFKGKNFTDDEWIEIIVENPKLLQRPIVEKEYKAVLAQPPENIDELL